MTDAAPSAPDPPSNVSATTLLVVGSRETTRPVIEGVVRGDALGVADGVAAAFGVWLGTVVGVEERGLGGDVDGGG